MKPRIIILMHYMELGGAEMSLLGLLHTLDYERASVDLFIYAHRGELMQHIPGQVRLLPEIPAYACIEAPITHALRRGQWGVAMRRLQAKNAWHKYVGKRGGPGAGKTDESIFGYLGKYLDKTLPAINPYDEYDLAISFMTPHNFALSKVKAKKRIAWIHTDYSTVCVNADLEMPVWGGFDSIISISPHVTKTFLRIFPDLRGKIMEMENILPAEYIRHKASAQTACLDRGELTVLSIGRFCHAKNFDNVPAIARRLVEKHNIDVRWYLIGYGGDEALIRRHIAEDGMADHVIVLGKQENPYTYITQCDIYAQPSRYEGKSITVREAQILGKPVIVSAYPTAGSQIKDGIDGVIAPQDNAGFADTMALMARDRELMNTIISNITASDYSGRGEIEKIYSLL